MSVGVFTPELRFKWVKGQVTSGTPDAGFVACGDGTAFPMEVTPDQLAEIMYRVRDAKCVSGIFVTSDDVGDYEIRAPTNEPTTRLYDVFGPDEDSYSYDVSLRGYCTTKREDPDDAGTSDATPENAAANSFGDTYYFTEGFDYPGARYPVAAADCVSELGMWATYDGDGGLGGLFGLFTSNYFKTGFNFYSHIGNYSAWIYGLPTEVYAIEGRYIEPGYNDLLPGMTAQLQFSGRVAYIDNDGSGNPFSLENKLFIGMSFDVDLDLFHFLGLTTHDAPGSGYNPAEIDLVLKFGNQEVRAPLYFYDSMAAPGEVSTISNAENFVFEAKQWWPYAKDSPAVPVWDATTGARIP